MTTLTQSAPAPVVAARRVMTGPNCYVSLPPSPVRKTALGAIAQRLADQTQLTTISVAITSGLVNAITEAKSPSITFQDMPPGMTGTLAQLQNAYGTFQDQFATFQGQASAWVSTPGGGIGGSILSQLVSVPQNLQLINSSVSVYFNTLLTNAPSSQAYQTAMKNLKTELNLATTSVQALFNSMQTLSSNLQTGAANLVTATSSGILYQLTAAYQTDINSLTAAINSANSTISSDNSKIIGEGFGAAVSVGVGLVGLLNIWNPFGWIMMGAGAVGAYEAISEIEMLKAQVSNLKNQIQTDTNFKTQDQQAAATLAAFVTQVQAFQLMNAGAQAELTALENLFNTLEQDVTTALTDLGSTDITDAQTEWNDAMSGAAFLSGLTAYIWPSPTLLSSPSSYAAIGNDIYAIGTSGEMYHLPSGASSWTDMGITALSCVGEGTLLAAIDGAPVDGTSISGGGTSTYFVKSYNFTSQSWSVISTFPASDIAVGNGNLYAVNQTVTDRQVYQYSGSGSTWNALPALPNSDCPSQIVVANGTLYALGNNTMQVYAYNGSSWSALNTTSYSAINANGNYLALVDINMNQFYYQPGTSASPVQSGWNTLTVAQLPNGMQLNINTTQQLWLANTQVSPITYTQLASNATAVFVSDTGVCYYGDNNGNLWSVTTGGTATQLPSFNS